MKLFVTAAIAISLFAPAAYAAQPGALDALLASSVQANVPAAPAAQASPALTSGLADLSAGQAEELAAAARANGAAVFELDGAKMTTKKDIMAYSAQALGLPADMDNWDAMIDYVGDMPTFHHNNKILIIVRNTSAIQNADAKLYSDFRNVADLSCQNAGEWSRSAVTLKFAFVP